MENEFKGKTAVVTGASRGIGAATAVALARRGVSKLILHYNGFKEGAESTARAVCEAGADVQTVQANLASLDGIRSLIQAMLASQTLNGVLLPLILIVMLVLVNDRRLMGRFANGRVSNVLSYTMVVILIALTVILVATSFFPS